MKKIFISVLLILGGVAVFTLGSPYYSVFPTNGNQVYQLALTLLFFIIAIILKRRPDLSVYGTAVYSLFIASVALLFLNTGILNLQRSTMPPLQNIAMDKFSQFLHVVPVIVALTLLAKGNLNAIFIGMGKLKQGLIFGLVSFVSFAVIALVMGLQSNEFFSSLWAALPWLLLFIFANAIMEELWFRGIFLRKYEAIIGRNAAIIVTAVVFGMPRLLPCRLRFVGHCSNP